MTTVKLHLESLGDTQPNATYGTVRHRPSEVIRAYGNRVLVQFEAKPVMSNGGLHLPLSQQVEPHWARCISVGHLVRETIPVGARLLVKEWMNGERCEGTPWHWMTEDSVLGVEE